MMEKTRKNNFFAKLGLKNKILFILGFVLLFVGLVLVLFSFRNEVLDEKYVITSATNYISKENSELHPGEIEVIKNTEYMEKGVYKITYITNSKKIKGKDILESDSYLTIIDELGDGYRFATEKIIVNDKVYDTKQLLPANGFIGFEYNDNILYIQLADELITERQVIELEIELKDRNAGVEYRTSKNSYYSFAPNIDNDFYNKKSYQAYIIDGFGSIKLKLK